MNTEGDPAPTSEGYIALGVRVGALEGDVREVNDRLLGLDTKLDKTAASIATEFRTALDRVTSQLSERQRTPWAVLISAATFVTMMLGVFGVQALSPMQADIRGIKEVIVPRAENELRYEALRSDVKTLREQIVPREEINYRSEITNRRFNSLEDAAKMIGDRRYNEMQTEIRELRNENRELKRSH